MSVFRNLLMSINETPPTPTRRHIQIGDVLKDKTLYFDIPDDIRLNSYFNKFNTYYYVIADWEVPSVPTVMGCSDRAQIWVRPVGERGSNFFVNIGGARYGYTEVYKYISGSLTINLTEYDLSSYSTVNNYFSNPIVWIDTNNPIYQCIWIEDE